MPIRFPVLVALAGLVLTGAAFAQSGPNSSAETYDDWTRRCTNVAVEGQPAAWRCELAQSVQLRETGQTLLEVALGQLDESGPIAVVVQVPNSVWLRTPITLAFGEAPEPEAAASASYFRCGAQVCLADLQPNDDLLDRLKSEETLVVSVEDGNRRSIRIPLSLAGFAEAFTVTFPDATPAEPKVAE